MKHPKLDITNRFARMARRHGRAAVLLIAMLTLAVACSRPNETPGEFKVLDNAQWKYGDTLVFNEKGDTLGGIVDGIAVSVRHTDDYAYANLWLELSYNVADSIVLDTFNLHLSNEYGKWLGSGSGPVIQRTDTIRPRLTPDDGSAFGLRHIMRVDILEGIEQIGMTYVTKERPARELTADVQPQTDSLTDGKDQ